MSPERAHSGAPDTSAPRMTLDLTGDIDAMMADDLGVDVTIGGVVGRGFLDQSDSNGQHGDGMALQTLGISLLVRTGVFTLSDNVAIVADGTRYTGRLPALEDDGKLTRIVLRRTA